MQAYPNLTVSHKTDGPYHNPHLPASSNLRRTSSMDDLVSLAPSAAAVPPLFLKDRVEKISSETSNSWSFVKKISTAASWILGSSVHPYADFLELASPIGPEEQVNFYPIYQKSWANTHPPQTEVESPAVFKLSAPMPADVLLSAFGDAVGYGDNHVEQCEDIALLKKIAEASFQNNVFDLAGFMKASGAKKFIFSDDTIESQYTEIALVRAAATVTHSVKDFIQRAEKELSLLLIRIDKCGDIIERTNGNGRINFSSAIENEIGALIETNQNTVMRDIEVLCKKAGAPFDDKNVRASFRNACNLAERIGDPNSRKEASQCIDAIYRKMLDLNPEIIAKINLISAGNVSRRPGCGAAMRAGVIGRVIANQFEDPSKVNPDDFRKGLAATAMLALSLSRLTHPQAGACLAAAVHAVTTYLIAFDFPLHDAQEIALEMFNTATETGRKYFEYIREKAVPNPELADRYASSWEISYGRMRCGLDMRKNNIFNTSTLLPHYKAQIISAPIGMSYEEMHTRPSVFKGALRNEIKNVQTESGMTHSWPGNSVDMPGLAAQCFLLALQEDVHFMTMLSKVMQQPIAQINPSRICPHLLRSAWYQLTEQQRSAIDAQITKLACLNQGDKDSIGAQAKMLQGMIFGIDAHTKRVILNSLV